MSTDDQTDLPEGELPNLSEDNRKFLRAVAQEAVENYVMGRPPTRHLYSDKALKQSRGAFVTLKVQGNLRGCIGTITSDNPLPETVGSLAVKSASHDPRFPPVGPAELDTIELEISILGPLREVNDVGEIKVGRDGLVIEHYGRHGLLLPQVATEHGLDTGSFLTQTCLKAGLPPDDWKKGARIYRFAAEVF